MGPRRVSREEWISRFRAKHGNKYDYSKANITTGRSKIEIVCPQHGSFWQHPENHAYGKGCKPCGNERSAEKQRLTQDEWLEQAMEVHGDRFDYSLVEYTGWDDKVDIICPIHGVVPQRAGSHITGRGCRHCAPRRAGDTKRWTTEQWTERAREIHGDFYDYSRVEYRGSWVEVEIICPIHDSFYQLAASHTAMRHGCPDCGREKQVLSQTYTQEDFLRLAHVCHGSRYIYSQAVYKPRIGGKQEPITIICRKHGPFPQKAHDHLQGEGCPDCKMEKLWTSRLLTRADFIERSEKVHGTYYDYSRVEYTRIKDFVEIICPKHGPFPQRAEGHLDGNGCPSCSNSTGEKAIAEFLETYGIEFETEKRFDGCRRILPLPFDFYLTDFTALIEFDGAQHFIPAGWFSTKERALRNLGLVQERDRIKNDWAKEKGVPLYRIRHDEDVKGRMTEILGLLGVI